MNWSNLQTIWTNQKAPAADTADLETIAETFESKSRRAAANLFWRDLREAGAGLLAAGFFAYIGWRQGMAYWPVALAVLLMLGVVGFFILERIRARRGRIGPGAPLLAKLEADIAELHHQHRLLLNVAAWYLVPIMAAVAIVLATTVANVPSATAHLWQRLFLAGYVAFCALLTWAIWALNRRVARTKLEPRILELERLRDGLLSQK